MILCYSLTIFMQLTPKLWAGIARRYSDLLEAGRSGDRIAVWGKKYWEKMVE